MDLRGNMQQIRIYTINRGKMDEFVQIWRQGIAPIRQKIGFEIVGAWVNKETNQFIWLMSYSGPEEWTVKDQEYFNSPDRKKLNPDPATLIARSEQHFVDPVETIR